MKAKRVRRYLAAANRVEWALLVSWVSNNIDWLIKNCHDCLVIVNAEEDTTTQRNGQADVLEPQISTKIVSGSNATHGADNDVGSQRTFNPNELRSLDEAFSEHHCANLARLAADRDSAEKPQRYNLPIREYLTFHCWLFLWFTYNMMIRYWYKLLMIHFDISDKTIGCFLSGF